MGGRQTFGCRRLDVFMIYSLRDRLIVGGLSVLIRLIDLQGVESARGQRLSSEQTNVLCEFVSKVVNHECGVWGCDGVSQMKSVSGTLRLPWRSAAIWT